MPPRSEICVGPLVSDPDRRESQADVERAAARLLLDPVVETWDVHPVAANGQQRATAGPKRTRADQRPVQAGRHRQRGPKHESRAGRPGAAGRRRLHLPKVLGQLRTRRESDLEKLARRVLANDAIEQVVWGPLAMESLSLGSTYRFQRVTVPIRGMDDAQLADLSRSGQLYLSLVEMQTIRQHFAEQNRDPTDVELETIAQTWSEHCSHKTLGGRIHYRDESRDVQFGNMLKETIFAATRTIRERLGADDWCVSVFKDNAGVVKFDEKQCVCFKVETHNHPSALEPYGGANTGLGGVIRDPLGTGLGARPVCNTDVFCFAPPDTPYESLPPGVLHPRTRGQGRRRRRPRLRQPHGDPDRQRGGLFRPAVPGQSARLLRQRRDDPGRQDRKAAAARRSRSSRSAAGPVATASTARRFRRPS